VNLGGIYMSVRARTDKYKRDLAKAKTLTGKAAVVMQKQISRINFAKVAIAGTAFTAGMVAMTKKIVTLGREFESTMKTVQAWSGATGKDLKDLTAIARKMGAETEHTATQAAGALKFLAAAGFSAKKSMAALPGTLDLATAGQVDLAAATDITTDVLTAFGLRVEELNRVNDAFITAASSSNTNVMMLGQSMKMVAPTAKLFGLTIEQTAGFLGTLANAGVKSEMAGSGLNMVLLKSQRAAKLLGMELDSSLIDVLKRMKAEQWDAVKIGAAFGARQVKTAAILMDNIGAYEKLTKKIKDNVGSTKKLAAIIRDSLDNDLKILNSTIQDKLLRTFETYKDDMRDIIQFTTSWIKENGKAIDQKVDEYITDISKAASGLFTTLKTGAAIYNSMPDVVVGAAGAGIVGRMLFGGWGPAKVLAMIYAINGGMKSFNMNMGVLVKDSKDFAEAWNEIAAVLKGEKDWNTGALLDTTPSGPDYDSAAGKFYMGGISDSDKPGFGVVSPDDTDAGAGGGGGEEDAKKYKKNFDNFNEYLDSKYDAITAANKKEYQMEIALAEMIGKDSWLIREEGMQAATEHQAVEQERQTQLYYDALQDRLQIQIEANQVYAEIGMTKFDIERAEVERMTEIYRQADVDKNVRDKIASDKSIKIAQAEHEAKKSLWDRYVEHTKSTAQQMTELSVYMAESFAAGVGDAFAGAIVYGENLAASFASLTKNLAAQVISSLVKIGVERLIQWSVSKVLGAAEATSRMGILAAETFAGAFAATAMIPIIGPALAPGVAIAATSAMLAGATAAAATGAAFGAGVASFDQGGISNARGVYQTGDIQEAHIPLPSGGKIPVKVEEKQQQRPNQIIMNNPVFQDLDTQRQVFIEIARQVAPGAVVENYNDDGPVRTMIRGGN